MKLDPYLTQFTKISLKWIKDLNTRSENVKLPEESIGGKLLDIGLGNDFRYNTSSTSNKSKK